MGYSGGEREGRQGGLQEEPGERGDWPAGSGNGEEGEDSEVESTGV